MRLSFGLAVVGVPVFVVILPLLLGQTWPIFVGVLLLGIYVVVGAQDQRRRGVYRTLEYRQQLKQKLVGTALGGVIGLIIAYLKFR
ncbi:MAG: hypothetical protein M3P30_03370 [Chloroflexota bacterium]|nr:hypothetical protein [Chloroflexota bacterium]